MTKISVPVSTLSGSLLDYVVAMAENKMPQLVSPMRICTDQERENGWWIYGDTDYHPSSDWNEGGHLLELMRTASGYLKIETDNWNIVSNDGSSVSVRFRDIHSTQFEAHGSNILEAAMRCLVLSVFGSIIDIPEELVKK